VSNNIRNSTTNHTNQHEQKNIDIEVQVRDGSCLFVVKILGISL